MYVGVQFQGSLPPHATQRWFTFNWPAAWDVAWMVVPTSPQPGAPELEWSVSVERASASYITYWITIHNLTGQTITLEARFAIFNIGGAAEESTPAAARALSAPQRQGRGGGPAPTLAAAKARAQPGTAGTAAIDAGEPPRQLVHA